MLLFSQNNTTYIPSRKLSIFFPMHYHVYECVCLKGRLKRSAIDERIHIYTIVTCTYALYLQAVIVNTINTNYSANAKNFSVLFCKMQLDLTKHCHILGKESVQ